MYIALLAVFSSVIAYPAEKNLLTNGDFSTLTTQGVPVSWKLEGQNISVDKTAKLHVVKIATREKYKKNWGSFRQQVSLNAGGLYIMTGEYKGNITEFLLVASYPREIQKNVSLSRAIFEAGKDGWNKFRFKVLVPDGAKWIGMTLQAFSKNAGEVFEFRSFKLVPNANNAAAAPKPEVKTVPAVKATSVSRQGQFFLPEHIYAVPGVESNIYWKNIFLAINYNNYFFDVDGAVGRNDQDRWRYTPKASEAGKSYPLTITVYNENGVVAKGSTTVHVTAADAGKGRNITLLMVGDSLTAADIFSGRVKSLFDKEKEGVKLTMIGSCTNKNLPGVANEGYGGWTWASFLALGAQSKFLQKKNGVYEFDLKAYLEKYNNGKEPDFITFQLGVNDVFGVTDALRKYKIAEVLENADTLLAKFRKEAPNAIIGVGFTTPSASSQDSFGIHYKNGQTVWGYMKNQFHLNQAMAVHFAEKMKKDKKLFLIPMQVNLDRDHNFPTMEEAINHGNSKKIIRQSNGVHPAHTGYYQMGDTLYAWLKYQLNQKK